MELAKLRLDLKSTLGWTARFVGSCLCELDETCSAVSKRSKSALEFG